MFFEKRRQKSRLFRAFEEEKRFFLLILKENFLKNNLSVLHFRP